MYFYYSYQQSNIGIYFNVLSVRVYKFYEEAQL